MNNSYASIEQAIETLRQGKMIVLLDDEHRENEGDLVIAADFATPEAINFMSWHGCGLICVPMAGDILDRLDIPMMVPRNKSTYETAFTVSIEAAEGVSTGVSAHDRAKTIQVAIASNAKPQDIVAPGHVFPLRAKPRGVLERGGHTEGSVDLMRLAGLTPAAVICEIMSKDGTMRRGQDLIDFAKEFNIPMVTIQDIINYRIRHETLVQETASTTIPLEGHGDFILTTFDNQIDALEHFALIKPPVHANQVPLVRIHSECITGDVFGSCKCDCGKQLQESLKLIAQQGGVLVYLRQEGRGIGLANKIRAYKLQESGLDTVEANEELGLPVDSRDYAVAFQILKHLGIDMLRILTNNPGKISTLESFGLYISERVALEIPPTSASLRYLQTKKEKLGHLLTVVE